MSLLIVLVQVHVKPDGIEAFRAASAENARQSRREPGVRRFDVIQQADDPSRFVLVEAYRDAAAAAAHKETPHYAAWRDAVAGLMAAPRTSIKYANVDPGDEAW